MSNQQDPKTTAELLAFIICPLSPAESTVECISEVVVEDQNTVSMTVDFGGRKVRATITCSEKVVRE